MKKISLLFLVVLLAFAVVLVGCSSEDTDVEPGDNETPPAANEDDEEEGNEGADPFADIEGELTIWAFTDASHHIEAFNEVYPNVTVNQVLNDWQGHHDNLKTAMASNSGIPDVFTIEAGFWGEFNIMPGIANLLDPPYNMTDFQDDFSPGNWEKTLTPDQSAMFGFGSGFPAATNFYRADLYEEAGIPTDPEELVTYFADWENVFDAAARLKARDRYMFIDAVTLLDLHMWSLHPFDAEVNYNWNNESMIEMLEVAQRIHQGGYAADLNIWTEEGQQGISSGAVTNLYMGTWIDGNLKNEWAADLEGAWRITALPGGIYAGQGGTFWSAYEGSNNPDAAAAWIRFVTIPNLEIYEAGMVDGGTNVPAYAPAWEVEGFDVAYDSYYGDQPIRLAIREIIQRVPGFVKTPFDGRAYDIAMEHFREAVEHGTDARAVLQNAQEDVERQLSIDIANRKEILGLE